MKDPFFSQLMVPFCQESFRAALLADRSALLSDLLFSCIILGFSIKKMVCLDNNHFFIYRSYPVNGQLSRFTDNLPLLFCYRSLSCSLQLLPAFPVVLFISDSNGIHGLTQMQSPVSNRLHEIRMASYSS